MIDLAYYRGFAEDHAPDGWPGIKMREVTALVDEIDSLQAQLSEELKVSASAREDVQILSKECGELHRQLEAMSAQCDSTIKEIKCAVRQFRHNDDNSGLIHAPEKGFVCAYDIAEVDRAISGLAARLRQQAKEKSE